MFTFASPAAIAGGAGYAQTTLTSGVTLGQSNISIPVASTAGFANSGTLQVVSTSGQVQTVTYTGKTLTQFQGCSGGSGMISSGAAIMAVVNGPSSGPTLYGLAATTLTSQADLPATSISVASTTGFAPSGTLQVVNSEGVLQLVTYTNKTQTQFQGCMGGTRTISSGTTITPAQVFATSLFNITPSAQATQFAASVYEVMSTEFGALINQPLPNNLPLAMNVVSTAIGGNLTTLPNGNATLGAEVRDLIKSILRGVYNFNAIPLSTGQWYPNPAKATGGQPFNVYNLDPFVYFVHVTEGLSGYGFSLDDDAADVGSNFVPASLPNNLSIAFDGIKGLANSNEWSASTPWGAVTGQATITTTVPTATVSGTAALPATTIAVTGSLSGFLPSGTLQVVNSSGVLQTVAYTGTALVNGVNEFTGCSGGTGTISAGATIKATLAVSTMTLPNTNPTTQISQPVTPPAKGTYTIDVGSTAGFASSGTLYIVNDNKVIQTVTYTGTMGTSFLHCSGGTGPLHVGDVVTQGTGTPFWKLLPDDSANAVVGAYVTGPGVIPGSRIVSRSSQNPNQFLLRRLRCPKRTRATSLRRPANTYQPHCERGLRGPERGGSVRRVPEPTEKQCLVLRHWHRDCRQWQRSH